MGYYTDYEMVPARYNLESLSENAYLAIEAFVETDKCEGWSYLRDVWYGNGNNLTWHEHDCDMRRLSTVFPSVLFTLWGRGEESDDLWKKYYLHGKCQVALGEIVYDEFDEEKLKDVNST